MAHEDKDHDSAAARAGKYVGITIAALCYLGIVGLCFFPMFH